MRGKLIVLFGIDGSGKSTVLKMLEKSGLENTVFTSCLTTAVFEEELYQAEARLHFSGAEVFSREFKHMLHIGSVIYKMINTVLPLLDKGMNVVLDRYIICVELFTNLFLEPTFKCISMALDCLPQPDLGIYFDTDIDTARIRLEERSRKTGERPHYSESAESLAKKKAEYERMIPYENYNVLRIDANQNISEVYSSVMKILNKECIPANADFQQCK